MSNRLIRIGLQTPRWLRPFLAFLLYWLVPVIIGGVMARAARSGPIPQLRAMIYLSVSGGAAALAYGVVGSFLYVRGTLRPWVLAFSASAVFFLSMASLSVSDLHTFARWEWALAIIAGGTAFGGAILRHFTMARSAL